MRINTLNLLLKDASKNIRRNTTTSIASIATIMATLFILGLFVLFMLNLKMGMISVYSQAEVRMLLKDNIKITEQQNIYKKIKNANGVIDIAFKKKAPMSVSCIITVNGPDDIPKIVSQLNRLQGIDKINSYQNIPKGILVKVNIIQLTGVVIFPILIAVTFFLIKCTMKLAIYPRLNEISIMQYLGATDWFIRCPFIFEGMIIGFLGAVSAVIALYLLYIFVYRQITSYPATMSINFINPYFIFTTLSWSFILIGIILTTIASILIINKFLIV